MNPIITPHISEKAIAQAEKGVYVFDVPSSTNKIEVAKAIENTFNVKVVSVNIMITKGKQVFWRQRGGKRTPGRRTDVKKAMVKLKKGDSIALFEEGKK